MTILRTIPRGGHPVMLVRIEPQDDGVDGEDSQLCIQIAAWMLDEAACAGVVTSEMPQIDARALVELRQLLDRLAEPSGNAPTMSGFMMAKGDRHETRETTAATRPNAATEATDT